MKKIIVTLFLALIIFITLGYSFFYISFNLIKPQNPINTTFRKTVLAHYFLKRIFRLKQVGDARFEYSSDDHFKSLKINVYIKEDETLNPETVQKSALEIAKTIKKPLGVRVENLILTDQVGEEASDLDLNRLIKSYPIKDSFWNKTTTVQIFVLKRYLSHPSYTGLVLDAQNIFLFMDPIRDVSDQQISSENTEISTILHEFAHLLGAEHIDNVTCILSEKVENITRGLPTYIRSDYCAEDLEAINRALTL